MIAHSKLIISRHASSGFVLEETSRISVSTGRDALQFNVCWDPGLREHNSSSQKSVSLDEMAAMLPIYRGSTLQGPLLQPRVTRSGGQSQGKQD